MNQKVEKGLATRGEIVAAATQLFAALGYAAVSIEAVLKAAGVSRGALYHHFASKEALFEAVFEAMEIDVAKTVVARSAGTRGVVRALRVGCAAFLDLAQEPAVRQIVLIDAPSVLGWEKWREIDARHGFGLIKAALARAASEGLIDASLAEPLAHLLLAALSEAAMLIAGAGDDAEAVDRAKAAADILIEQMLGQKTGRRRGNRRTPSRERR